MSGRSRIVVAAVSVIVLAAAVGAVVLLTGNDSPTKHVAAPTPTPTPSSSKAQAARPLVFPLTGLRAPSQKAAQRPSLSIKIDNVDDARPQAGVNAADIVVEEVVEGGLTRLFAVYQSHGVSSVGPIRSARPADAELLRAVGGGIFAFSGADPRELRPIHGHSHAVLLSNDEMPQWFSRVSDRPAPHNVFTSTDRLYAGGASVAKSLHKKLTPARPFFRIGQQKLSGRRVRNIATSASGFAGASWTYRDGRYWRSQNGTVDKLTSGEQIWADNIVVMRIRLGHTGIFDAAHNEDPLDILLGQGSAWVAHDGRLVAGSWRRHGEGGQTRLVTASGHPILLPPGRTWVELIPTPRRPAF